jgi:glutamine synthetase
MAKNKIRVHLVRWLWTNSKPEKQNKVEDTKTLREHLKKLEMVFDGSSTKQAEGGSSDCLLVPVAIYPDPIASMVT